MAEFQFQNGTIKRRHPIAPKPCPHLRFNSKMVQLKAGSGAYAGHAETFQFQNGTIKSMKLRILYSLILVRFNSKMVQLKGNFPKSCFQIGVLFQFQNGTIKRDFQHDQLFKLFRFNSKMVQLKGIQTRKLREREALFQFQNGTIKRSAYFVSLLNRDPFQFQNGTIKSGEGWDEGFVCESRFNSKMVQLKAVTGAGA